jgi:riboflavin synthase
MISKSFQNLFLKGAIIEEIGTVKQIQKSDLMYAMTIEAKIITQDIHLGDSIAVNGVCLTVTTFNQQAFTVDIMPESIKSTSLSILKKGAKVNLERAMQANGRFGGHFVSGHVDGVGQIVKKEHTANAVYYSIQITEDLRPYFLLKGSVTVDGTSLTVFGVHENSITISLIPHTFAETILGKKEVGSIVNIECDMIGKYIQQMIHNQISKSEKTSITSQFLEENGFK